MPPKQTTEKIKRQLCSTSLDLGETPSETQLDLAHGAKTDHVAILFDYKFLAWLTEGEEVFL